MKLFVLNSALKSALITASRIAQKSLNLPILNDILLKTEKNWLKIATTDLETSIQIKILAKIEKQGNNAVPARILTGLVQSIVDEKVELEGIGHNLHLKSDKIRAKILGHNPDDYPIIPEIRESFLKLDSQVFISALAQVADFAATSKIKPELSGVYLSFEKNILTLAASDSFRLAEKKITLTQSFGDKKVAFIIPQKCTKEVINVFAEQEGELELLVSQNQIMFEQNNSANVLPTIKVSCQLIEGTYPQYQSIIPASFSSQVTVARQEFQEALRAVAPFSGKSSEVKLTVSPDKGIIEISAASAEAGESQNQVSCQGKGQEINLAFNHRFLEEGLSKLKSSQALLQLTGQESPAVLHSPDDETFLYVVMPIKS